MRGSFACLVAAGIIAASTAAHADTIADSVNLSFNGDSGAYWGATDVGWFYTPASSYSLSGIETKFSIPVGTSIEDRTVTVVVYQGNTPANGGTLLGSFNFNSAVADNNTLGGGTFASSLSLTAGTTYFIGFENVGPGPDSTGNNVDDLGVNFTADSATFLSNLYFDGGACATPGPFGTFACEDTATDILGQPILAFLTPPPTTPPMNGIPEPASLVLLGSALLGMGAFRRAKKS